jgi:hypothetical protein
LDPALDRERSNHPEPLTCVFCRSTDESEVAVKPPHCGNGSDDLTA